MDPTKNVSSIYEKFKQNTRKMFNDESFKETTSRGHQVLESRISSMNTKKKDSNKSRGQECRNFSQAPLKNKGTFNQDNDSTGSKRSGSKIGLKTNQL